MISLIKTYFLRLKKSLGIIICFALILLIDVLILLSTGSEADNCYYMSLETKLVTPAEVMQNTTYNRLGLLQSMISPISTQMIIFIVALISFFGQDWSNDTFRNPILAGKKRTEIYNSAIIFSFICYLFFFIFALFLSFVPSYFYHMNNALPMLTPSQNFIAFIVTFLSSISIIFIACFIIFSIHGEKLSTLIYMGVLILMFVVYLCTIRGYSQSKENGTVLNYYTMQEWSLIYQYVRSNPQDLFARLFTSQNIPIDYAVKYIPKCTVSSTGTRYYFTDSTIIEGRSTIILLKSIATFLFHSVPSYFVGRYLFKKRDLR